MKLTTASPTRPDDLTVSVVVRSRNEEDRLRLTLASLEDQCALAEIVVVDDGSADGTAALCSANDSVTLLRHSLSRGRAAASNAGAAAATGDILLFLDGDTLMGPGTVAAHAALHRTGDGLIGRGETWHLRCTRLLADPETGRAQPAHADTLHAMAQTEREALRVTRAQIRHDFSMIERRARPGIYPGAGPRQLHDLEMGALRRYPDCPVLWAAASGSNLSVGRRQFLEAGGFDEALDINEHREIALRLTARGACMRPVEGARTYHMTHRSGWRDPLTERGWYATFYRRHPLASVALLPRFWAGIGDPAIAAPRTLPELAAMAAAEDAALAEHHP